MRHFRASIPLHPPSRLARQPLARAKKNPPGGPGVSFRAPLPTALDQHGNVHGVGQALRLAPEELLQVSSGSHPDVHHLELPLCLPPSGWGQHRGLPAPAEEEEDVRDKKQSWNLQE